MTLTDTSKNITRQRRDAIVDTPMKPILDALNDCLRAIRERHPEVPNAVLVVGPDSQKNYGHFAPASWDGIKGKHTSTKSENEIRLNGEGLARGAEATLGTLIHECGHALANTRGIKDTSRDHRFHNAKFKAIAEELGIEVAHDKTIGWSVTTLPADTAKLYKVELLALRKALKTFRLSGAGKPPRAKTTVKIECGCRSVTVPISFYTKGPISCALCGSEFESDIEIVAGTKDDGWRDENPESD